MNTATIGLILVFPIRNLVTEALILVNWALFIHRILTLLLDINEVLKFPIRLVLAVFMLEA